MNIVIGISLILAGGIILLYRWNTGKIHSSFLDVWNIVCGIATLIGLYLSLQQIFFNNINEKVPIPMPSNSVGYINGSGNTINQGNSTVNINELPNDRGFSSKLITEPVQQDKVFDSKTNLTWQKIARCGNDRYNWTEANNYCKGLEISGKNNWRLPSIQELKDVLERKTFSSSDTKCFDDSYWTSSLYKDSEYAYLVPHDTNRSSHKRRINEHGYTWCVHD
jgi:hypothetical protein